MPCTSLAGMVMLSIAVSKSLCGSGSRWPVQYYAWKVCGRAEQSQSQELLLLSWSSPVPPWSFMDILPLNRVEFVFQLSVEKSRAKFLSIKRIQQEDSLFSHRSFCHVDKCLNPLVLLWKRGNSISLLLPSPAESPCCLRQELPLSWTDLCLTPISAGYHLVYL